MNKTYPMKKGKYKISLIIMIACAMMIFGSPHKSSQIEQQIVTVEDFDTEGFILDIGGGGEGVIGRLLVWDVLFPELTDKKKNMALFPFKFILPDKEIRTGYGVRRPEGEQGLAHFMELAKKTGFQIVSHKEKDRWFFLEVVKRPK